ncbi:RimK/LysX family protein [Altererythrobacter sp. H2]|uniref:ATP-dependent zinc protease family protein n=1 Tax=Altererythrobacter sp. H2 TaxID=3108391 RepID=UPI002B4C05AE|nr:RimK/LysX family protein [Altererythrobacter sp. H2]WRK97031.1 RimK/LysX family protein [Altererythrobacter sp. H2]
MAIGDKQLVGWRERVGLPDLFDGLIPAKIDTGAKTSSLHATGIERYLAGRRKMVRFLLDVGGGASEPVVCELPHADHRIITSSNGQSEERLIIKTRIAIGSHVFRAEFSLTDRSDMKFPILVGRTALRRGFLVDSSRSYLQSGDAERRRILR